MQRSGTTLLEKLLASHPEISVLSQPFPLLFVEAKRAFLRDLLGESPAYPLGPLFGEERYTPSDLARFLSGWRPGPAEVREVFAALEGFSGQYTRFGAVEREAALAGLAPGDLGAVVSHLYRALSGSPEARVHGGKETICEELLPFLLDRGCRGIVILRDPRDVLASLNHGRGREHGGRLKPTLYNLRNWRKSVAFALHLEAHPLFARIRYEDLAARPAEVLSRLAGFLGVPPFEADLFASGIRDRDGRLWEGNSSHGALHGVSAASVGVWREVLPPGAARFVEAACYPELVRLGYPVSLAWEEVPAVLASFEDPYGLEREDLAEHTGPAARSQELRRLELLPRPASAASRPAFLFEDVHDTLRAAVLPS
ncbi:MAG TPA: sulfotransferase domain-containing protein [Thermoanaerobaculia bacterium]|nr:sulfotransferase domain-containing protein [Thermoanaerobaculia bacterium]